LIFRKRTGLECQRGGCYRTGSSSSIETGDRPVEINGRPAQIFLEQYDQAGTVWGPLIHDLTVIDDQGNSKSVVLAGNAQPIVGKIQWLMWLLVCIVFWISGYYVFFKKPKYKAAVLLLLCGLVLDYLRCHPSFGPGKCPRTLSGNSFLSGRTLAAGTFLPYFTGG